MSSPRTRTLTAARLRELTNYNSETGVFVWRDARRGCRVGEIAGRISRLGYVHVRIDQVTHLGHRLAWLYIHREFPPQEIDHINGNRADNRIVNLRCATKQINAHNQRRAQRNSKVGLLGVSPSGKKWRARIKIDKKDVCLGTFQTPQKAHAAYLEAKRKYHPSWPEQKIL